MIKKILFAFAKNSDLFNKKFYSIEQSIDKSNNIYRVDYIQILNSVEVSVSLNKRLLSKNIVTVPKQTILKKINHTNLMRMESILSNIHGINKPISQIRNMSLVKLIKAICILGYESKNIYIEKQFTFNGDTQDILIEGSNKCKTPFNILNLDVVIGHDLVSDVASLDYDETLIKNDILLSINITDDEILKYSILKIFSDKIIHGVDYASFYRA